ncbi:MAG: hypothetical protein MMC33_006415 [Icmadophila ericetorum]|nr:hypothetical protein [Icmadophila ericetorum]
MPIKLPKGFARRKSAGNVLEESLNPPAAPSFRVVERPDVAGSKSFDGGISLKKRTSLARPLSEGQYLENKAFQIKRLSPGLNNRGSSGTDNSYSSTGLNDNSSYSARFSSTSTLPSSVSTDTNPNENSHAHPKMNHSPQLHSSQPSSPSIFSLRAAGRTFSFGRKYRQPTSPQETPEPMPDLPEPISAKNLQEYGSVTRPRAMTEDSHASGSTATPPKLLDSDLNFGGFDDGFGSMFDGFGSKERRLSKGPGTLDSSPFSPIEPTAPAAPRHAYLGSRAPFTPPPPLDVEGSRNRDIVASPLSFDSHDSRQGLTGNLSPREEQRKSRLDEGGYSQQLKQSPGIKTVPPRKNVGSPSNPSKPRRDSALQRSSIYAARRESTPMHDTDALLVITSLEANERLDRNIPGWSEKDSRNPVRGTGDNARSDVSQAPQRAPPASPKSSYAPTSQFSSRSQGIQRSPVELTDQEMETATAWRDQSVKPTSAARESILFDADLQELARSAEQYQVREPSPKRPPQPGKVMTPAQFEKYRRDKEMMRTMSDRTRDDSSEDGDDNDNYDYDDEAERNKELIKQRRKQEAHLAVYRQQMMKVTGEQPDSISRPGIGKLSQSMLLMNLTDSNGKSSEDEDEDIPLGILAAHGFPSKDRIPGQMDRTASPNICYTSETYPPPSLGSGSQVGGSHTNLPAFARNLPKDPYYGASIVPPTDRESFALGSGASAYGGSQVAAPPGAHPGGLVGVIASEEKARALRRGSPNAQGGFGSLPLPQGMAPMGMPMGTPGEQAQLQMSAQMTQMMQMQMQFMQQMMAMQQGQQRPMPMQMPMPPQNLPGSSSSFLSPPNIQASRPASMGAGISAAGQAGQQRTMSMLDPTVGNQWAQRANRTSMVPAMMSGGLGGHAPSYTPSIAPSERSNIGQPTRYRPVSIAPMDDNGPRSAGNAMSGWQGKQGPVQATIKVVPATPRTPKPPNGGASRASAVDDDEDDEEGWEEMKAKVEKRKSGWRLRKNKDGAGLGELFYPGT